MALEFLHEVPCIVARSVIDNHDEKLVCGVFEAKQGFDRILDRSFLVEDRYQNRHGRIVSRRIDAWRNAFRIMVIGVMGMRRQCLSFFG